MVDRVVKMAAVHNVEHVITGSAVLLKITGKTAGKVVRLEIPLDNWEVGYVTRAISDGVAKQVAKWTEAQNRLKA